VSFPSLDEVVQQLRAIAENDGITADDKIAALEIDSLDVLEWVFEIEGQAGVVIDDSLYDGDSLADATIGDFYERVKTASA
jgi:acyl carrier protein